MVAGRPIWASAWAMAAVASLSDFPGARLNEMVVAGWVSWWLTAVGVDASAQAAIAERGTCVSAAPLTATPWEAPRGGGAAGPATALAPTARDVPRLALACPGTPATAGAAVELAAPSGVAFRPALG